MTGILKTFKSGKYNKHKINLADIEPLPTRKKAWDYCFFIDFAGHDERSFKRRPDLDLSSFLSKQVADRSKATAHGDKGTC